MDVLNHIKLGSFIEQAGSNKFRLLVLHDNLNLFKSLLNKFKDLNADSVPISLEESEKAYAIISNLLNITLLKNRWFSTWKDIEAGIKTALKSLASGLYVGASTRQGRPEGSLTAQWQSYTHGPPIIRL